MGARVLEVAADALREPRRVGAVDVAVVHRRGDPEDGPRDDVSVDELLRAWTIVTSGLTTQQLANAPDEPFDEGTFTTLLPQIVAMYCAHYAPRTKARGRKRHADQR